MQMRLFNHFKIMYLNDFMHPAEFWIWERLGPLQERITQQPSNRGKICQNFSKNTIFGIAGVFYCPLSLVGAFSYSVRGQGQGFRSSGIFLN